MERFFIHNPIFRLLAPIGYGILIYLLILLINNNVAQINDIFDSQEVYMCIGLSYLSLESTRLVILAIERYSRINNTYYKISFQVITSAILSTGLVLIVLHAYFLHIIGFSISITQLIIFSSLYLATTLLYNLLYFSNYFLRKENTVRLKQEEQQRDVLEMEISEFKNDINPDLLYESLENIIYLSYKNKENAELYIDHLATAYRYILTNRKQELVPLKQEIDIGNNLIVLLNIKHNGQIKFHHTFTHPPESWMVIPNSISTVLEYIIRNTIIAPGEPMIIEGSLEDDEYLVIQSKLSDRLILHEPSQVALNRLQRSYALFSDLPLIRVKAYSENYIKIPLIKVTEEVRL